MSLALPRARSGAPPLPRAATLIAGVIAVLLAVAGCSGSSSPGGAGSSFAGSRLPSPITLDPAQRAEPFRSSAGGITTLAQQQANHLMLVYFGYTHCPDVCPTTMADIAQALRSLPRADQSLVQVVLVTSDPDRDSPAVMATWLRNFDSSLPRTFVGLTSSTKKIYALADAVGVPLEAPKKQSDGTVTVQHGAQTLAFVHNRSDVVWTAGTTPSQYAHDLRLLLRKLT